MRYTLALMGIFVKPHHGMSAVAGVGVRTVLDEDLEVVQQEAGTTSSTTEVAVSAHASADNVAVAATHDTEEETEGEGGELVDFQESDDEDIEAPTEDMDERKIRWLIYQKQAIGRDYDFDMLPPYVGVGPRRADVCPRGTISLEGMIIKTHSSSIYNARIVPNLPHGVKETPIKRARIEGKDAAVIKYYNDCFERSIHQVPAVHPLVHEFAVMRTLSGYGIVPEVEYVSPEADLGRAGGRMSPASSTSSDSERLTPSNRVKTQSWVNITPERCAALGTKIRFLVMDEVGMSVSAYMQERARNLPVSHLADILRISIKIMDLLNRLHNRGFVHGDFHGGNVAFRRRTDDPSSIDAVADDLVLIDFGLAEFFIDKVGATSFSFKRRDLGLRLLSPWHLEDTRLGPRDDVFRALETIASWLTRGLSSQYFQIMLDKTLGENPLKPGEKLKPTQYQLADIKKSLNYFHPQIMEKAKPAGSTIPAAKISEISTHLRAILTHVRSIPSPDTMPDYGFIMDGLRRALAATGTA